MSFEEAFLNRIDKKPKESLFHNKAILAKLGEKIFRKVDVYRPDPREFEDIYGREVVESDISQVEAFEKKSNEERVNCTDVECEKLEVKKNIATILEGITLDQLSGEWLGGRAMCYPTSKYDDYFRGVDMVAEFPSESEEQPHEYLGFAIDSTSALDQSGVVKKLNRIKDEEVLKNRPATVKYFEGEEVRGPIQLPRTVFAISNEVAKQLLALENKGDMEAREALSGHYAQCVLLRQLKVQLSGFVELARRHGYEKIVLIYSDVLRVIDEIIEDKSEQFDRNKEKIKTDEGLRIVSDYMDRLLKN